MADMAWWCWHCSVVRPHYSRLISDTSHCTASWFIVTLASWSEEENSGVCIKLVLAIIIHPSTCWASGKHCHYFLMKATFVKFEPSAMHLQWLWIKISMSMQANFCLWINLEICTNLWLFEWKESKNFAWCVCLWEHRAQ